MWSGVLPRQYGISIISIVRCPVRSAFNTGYYGASTSLWKDCSTTVCACHIFRRTYCTQVFLLCSEETLSEFDSLCVSTSCQTNKNDLIQLNLCNATIWNGDDNSDEWEYCDKYGFTCVFLDGGLSWFPCAVTKQCMIFHIFSITHKCFNLTFDRNNPRRFCGRHGNSCFRKFSIGIIDNLSKACGTS